MTICRPTWKCIELDTPRTIYEDGNDYYPPETDIFQEVADVTTLDFEHIDVMINALWWRYRNYIIGACDTTAWVQGVADRLDLVGTRWDEIIDKMLDTDMTNLTDREYDRLIKRTPITGTNGDIRTVHYEHENLPQTVADTTKYLDVRSDNTDTYAPNTQDEETFRERTDPDAVTFSKMLKAYPNVFIDFTDDFKEYFIDRWY